MWKNNIKYYFLYQDTRYKIRMHSIFNYMTCIIIQTIIGGLVIFYINLLVDTKHKNNYVKIKFQLLNLFKYEIQRNRYFSKKTGL